MSVVNIRTSFAYYLPQFHAFPENNEWWGDDFTEWTHVKSAKSYSRDHQIYQPHDDLGYYRLEDISIMEKQYELAKNNGIDCFCFWNYWFGHGEKLMEAPLEKLLLSDIDIKYCVSWANHSWFNKTKGLLLKEQKYPGEEDIYKHFEYLSRFFLDKRYKVIDNKPVLFVFQPSDIPYFSLFKKIFDDKCKELGFSGIFLISENSNASVLGEGISDCYIDSRNIITFSPLVRIFRLFRRNLAKIRKLKPITYNYAKRFKYFNNVENTKQIPVIIPGWDSTIRHGERGWYFNNASIEQFSNHVRNVKDILENRNWEDRIFLVKSWNEWAEGNFIEPDSTRGYALLDVVRSNFKIKCGKNDN
ncbi:glycoside hydrolase family 99-like domain-containing protein [Aliivibrio sp. 1S128]|uniref:glycosyltransferase WbsX family protein n=1 Tax=Aliivibrio sp. 1S128 TaxID=1840085 RepID=UPI00080E6C9D|nr:glycoside hydrolase family 99-like domain-containing protein [Aliivibrio sp. 1S128]OCH25521.1 hypothetical protein A6E03_01605 [Aliivibrio sp. 1S128]